MADWHPRETARPVRWELRTTYGDRLYATMSRIAVDRFQVESVEGEILGEWPTGDEAVMWAYRRHIETLGAPGDSAPNGQR